MLYVFISLICGVICFAFAVTKTLVQNVNNIYYLPSQSTTGDDYYLINKILCYNAGVLKGEAEKVSNSKINLLNKSLLTAPSDSYPAYTQKGDSVTIFPSTFNGALDVQATYIRYPKDPKWTFVTLFNGEPLFDQTQSDYQDQFDLLMDIRNRTTEINEKIITIRSIKKQVNALSNLMSESGFKNEEITKTGKELIKNLSNIEEEMIQVKSKSRQDPLNYPIKLDNKIAALVRVVASVDAKPTAQSYDVLNDLVNQAQVHYKKLDKVLSEDLFQFNNMVSDAAVPAVMVIPSKLNTEDND